MNELSISPASQAAELHFCTFRLGGQRYGIELSAVREVSGPMLVTPVPHAPPHVRGLANLRSRIYLVLDLGAVLGLSPAAEPSESRVVILKDSVAENVGLIVDAGGEIVTVTAAAVERTESASDEEAAAGTPQLVTDVCRLADELLMVVDAKRVTRYVKSLMT